MPFRSRAVFPLDEGNVGRLTFLRLMVATLVVGAAIVALQVGGEVRSAGTLYGLLAVVYLSGGSIYAAVRAGAPSRVLAWTEIALDCAAVTLLLHFTGGAASHFAVLYVLPILMGGVCFEVKGGLATAVLATGSFVGYGLLAPEGPAGAIVRGASGGTAEDPLFRAYLYLAVFVLTGLLSGYLSTYVRARSDELAAKDAELRHVQLHTDSIITNVSSGLIVTNTAGEIVTCNPAAFKILGFPAGSEVKGQLVQDAFPHMGALVQELESALATGTPRRRHELDVRRRDGTELPLGISISLLKGDAGERRGVVAIFQDLTEVNHMREKVRRADKMAAIGELSTAIAHEIRAPLASICGSIEMLAGELSLSGDNKKLMELVIKESDRLDRIITDFLEFARLKRPAFEPVDVEQCLSEVLLLLKHSSDVDRTIAIEVVPGAPHACVYADDEQLRQVFLNIIMNACEAMGGGGRLTVRVDAAMKSLRDGSGPEQCVAIDFENDGPAIPEDVLPHVFEPFFTTKEGGTGLGLAIVARIVESHFGHIRVASRPEGGAIFSIVLPVYSGADVRRTESLQEEFISF